MLNQNEFTREENASENAPTADGQNALQTESLVVNGNYEANLDAIRNSKSKDSDSNIDNRASAESQKSNYKFQVDSESNATNDTDPGASRNSTNSGVYTSPVYTDSENQRNNHQGESNSFCTFCHVHFKTIVIALFIVLILGIDFTNLEMLYRFSFYDAPLC